MILHPLHRISTAMGVSTAGTVLISRGTGAKIIRSVTLLLYLSGDGIIDVQDLIVLADYIGKEVRDPTLLAHWKLDETEGITACDSAGRCDATVCGEIHFGSPMVVLSAVHWPWMVATTSGGGFCFRPVRRPLQPFRLGQRRRAGPGPDRAGRGGKLANGGCSDRRLMTS